MAAATCGHFPQYQPKPKCFLLSLGKPKHCQHRSCALLEDLLVNAVTCVSCTGGPRLGYLHAQIPHPDVTVPKYMEHLGFCCVGAAEGLGAQRCC